MTDADIVTLYWARDEQAIAQTAQKFGAYCRKIAMNLLGSQEDAEDGTGRIGAEAELSLHEQHENGQHGVVAEAFSHITQSCSEQPLRMIFKHR